MDSKKKLPSFEEFVEMLPEPIYWLDLNQRIIGFNSSALSAAGAKSKEELIGKTPLEIYPKEMAEEIIAHHQEVIKTGTKMTVEESIVDRTTGETKVFDATIGPLYDEDNNIIGTCGISVDTTERKRQKEQLEKQLIFQQHLFAEFAELVPGGFYWCDLNHKLMGANTFILKSAGMKIEDVLGKTPLENHPKEMAEEIIAHHRNVIQTGKQVHCEESIVNPKTGETVFFDVMLSPLYDENKDIIGVCGISTDITERKKLFEETIRHKNQLEKKLKFQRAYLKSFGFECIDALRTMSASIDTIDRRLMQLDVPGQVSTDLLENFYEINESLCAMYTMYQKINSQIIIEEENIRNFDKIRELPMCIESLIATEIDMAQASISAEFDVEVSFEMDEKSKQKINVDHKKLQHIIRTLLLNYTKAINKNSRKRDIHLSITAKDGWHNKLYVTFEFSGNMPFLELEDDQFRAEHLMYKTQTSIASEKHDFAYDLSLAKHYAKVLCEGEEKLNASFFEGPEFSFTLPFRKTEEDKDRVFKPRVIE